MTSEKFPEAKYKPGTTRYLLAAFLRRQCDIVKGLETQTTVWGSTLPTQDLSLSWKLGTTWVLPRPSAVQNHSGRCLETTSSVPGGVTHSVEALSYQHLAQNEISAPAGSSPCVLLFAPRFICGTEKHQR